MNETDYFNKRPDQPGYDPRIKKYYELIEENEALQKKIRFMQEQINNLERENHDLYWFGVT